ncbi:hypothetical protein SAMN05660462_01199 [Proteiniborus ethanoligenes]|uniref:Uncharacterized protein n=1 Tax=Proteiniborus ethanoligenes TaxID=415015 RepID=A0A1H3NQR8_9FIRM|nr:hypothetical protein [Proteiniborus ethanoligenes]SDY91113.1 hypothetical protein SAMN05660462_01199 [Proteiniborus ethanoligenes]
MDWKEINSENDINDLLKTFGGFHDGVLREMHLWNDYYVDEDLSMDSGDGMLNAKVLFQRQGKEPSTIEMLFWGVNKINIISTPPNHWYMIFDTTLVYKDGLYYWAEAGDWEIGDNSVTWLSSKNIKWRSVDGWLGSKLKYGTSR